MLKIISIVSLLVAITTVPVVFAQVSTSNNYTAPECVICVPEWIKNNAGWWADGTIDDNSFTSGIQWLVTNDIIQVPPTTVSTASESAIPSWVKNTADWWADNQISDDDFVNAIQHLIKVGIMTVPQAEQTEAKQTAHPSSSDSSLVAKYEKLKVELEKCKEYDKGSEVFLCENEFKSALEEIEYMMEADKYELGPVHYYYKPAQVVITPDGNSNLFLTFVIHNTDNKDQAIFCTGPVACNYMLTDGKKDWVYSTNTVTAGRLVMKPDTINSIDFSFGPPAQRHLERWDYDSSSEYFLKITEPFGKLNLPLKLTIK